MSLLALKQSVMQLALPLVNPSNYHKGVGAYPEEPSNILILRRDHRQPINTGKLSSRLCHDRYVLSINLRTTGLVRVERQIYQLPVDSASLVRPYQLHYYMVNQNDFFWLVFTFEMRSQCLPLRCSVGSVPLDELQYHRLLRMLWLYGEILAGKSSEELLLQRLLGNFLLEMSLCDHAEKGLPPEGAVAAPERPNADIAKFEEVNRYIVSHMDEPRLSVEGIAADLGLSASRLYRMFNTFAGCNPGEYIRNQRIRQAMRMLEERRMGIATAAAKNGFTSLAIFSRCFRKIVGMSPRQYIAMQRND